MLEITMTIKCGNCIRHDNYSFSRDTLDDNLAFVDTINNNGFGYFKAKNICPDTIEISCANCGHVDKMVL